MSTKAGYKFTAKILRNLAKPRPDRTEAEVFAGLSDEVEPVVEASSDEPERCAECGKAMGLYVEGPVLRCLRCQKALCFLCTGGHLDCRNRCEEAK